MPDERTEMEKRHVRRLSNEKASRLTRECLQTALIHLMAEKELDQITVTELVAKAGVSRTAFYANYSSKEEILTNWLTASVDQLCELIREALRTGKITEIYVLLFDRIRQDVDSFSVLFKANLQELLFSRMEASILKQFTTYDTETKYLMTAWCGALNYLIVRWIKDGMKESSSEIALICRKLTDFLIDRLRLKYPGYFVMS